MDVDRVILAEILRPRGNRGEVLARSLTDVPGRLESLKEAQYGFQTVRMPQWLFRKRGRIRVIGF